MDSRARTLVCGQCSLEDLSGWAEKIRKKEQVSIIKKPDAGLIMMRMRDPVTSQIFNLGEVLVTDCMIKLGDLLGYGQVLGNQPERAEACAVLDALFNSADRKWANIKKECESWLAKQAAIIREMKDLEFEMVSRSRVEFETMTTQQIEDGD